MKLVKLDRDGCLRRFGTLLRFLNLDPKALVALELFSSCMIE